MNASIPKIFVLDGDDLALQAIAKTVVQAGYRVGTFTTACDLMSSDLIPPCCAVLEVQLPDAHGLAIQGELATRHPLVPVIFVTRSPSIQTCVSALQAGAIHYLSKPFEPSVLLGAIQKALEVQIGKFLRFQEHSIFLQKHSRLTHREQEVLKHLVTGALNKQIAGRLGTCEKTIKVHRGRIMRKMAVDSLAELVRLVERTAQQSESQGFFRGGDLSAATRPANIQSLQAQSIQTTKSGN
jgi:FixJ family two-component response regulator